MRTNNTLRLLTHLVSHGDLRDEPFFLVDVGVGGGIGSHWRCFGDSFDAVGFDVRVDEVDRLNKTERNSRVKYRAARVGYARYGEMMADCLPFTSNIYARSSSQRARELLRACHIETDYDQLQAGVISSDLLELDEYFLRTEPASVDLIKSDTDSRDYEVLLGAKELLVKSPVVGLIVETSFHGQLHEAVNLWL
jgi:hypothetical protein